MNEWMNRIRTCNTTQYLLQAVSLLRIDLGQSIHRRVSRATEATAVYKICVIYWLIVISNLNFKIKWRKINDNRIFKNGIAQLYRNSAQSSTGGLLEGKVTGILYTCKTPGGDVWRHTVLESRPWADELSSATEAWCHVGNVAPLPEILQ